MIALNGFSVNPTIFPDGTSQIWKLSERCLEEFRHRRINEISWDFEHEGELIHLAQLSALLGELCQVTDLYLPYLPYGRQDKKISNHSTFALRVFAQFINALRFRKVLCFDPHSSVAIDLIDRLEPIWPTSQVHYALEKTCADLLAYPDNGAVEKYKVIFPNVPFLEGVKERDPITGHISAYSLLGNPSNKRVLIVDDICDGGRTFIMLAEQLKKFGARAIHLFVSHGLFSKGTGPLREAGISRIFTKERELL